MDGGTAPRHSVSVSAVIVNDDDQVLAVQRRDNGRWEPPGGVLELNESIEDGLTREVREETGLRVTIDELTGAYKNMPRGIVALVFRCRPTSGHLTTGPETAELRWLTLDQVRDVMDEAYAVRIFDALEAGPPHVRTHDGTSLLA
jgi:8-oxo-dGTP diphosphatase